MIKAEYASVIAMTSERNSPRFGRTSTPRRKGMRSLSGLTETLLGPALRGRVAILGKIITHWPELAGEAASWSQPIDIQFSGKQKSDGVLVLSIRSGTGPQTQMMTRTLCDSINSLAGYAMVSRIRLVQNLPAPVFEESAPDSVSDEASFDEVAQSKLEHKLSTINSPELRAALLKLGQTVNSRQKTD